MAIVNNTPNKEVYSSADLVKLHFDCLLGNINLAVHQNCNYCLTSFKSDPRSHVKVHPAHSLNEAIQRPIFRHFDCVSFDTWMP